MSAADFARAGGHGGRHLLDRLPMELVAMCRGLLMDGAIVDREVVELDRWCKANPAAARSWPGNQLTDRLYRILGDGVIDEDERADLHEFMEEITAYRRGHQEPDVSIFTDPQPDLVIIEEHFTLTGTFLYGPRSKVRSIIESIGGIASDALTRRTNYLLVGSRASSAWLEANRGSKIMQAIDLNRAAIARGDRPILPIVREEHWSRFILKPAP